MFGHYAIVDSELIDDPLTRVGKNTTVYRVQHFAAGYTKILNARMLNDFRLGINRVRHVQGGILTDTDFTQPDLGFDFRVISDNNRPLNRLEQAIGNNQPEVLLISPRPA